MSPDGSKIVFESNRTGVNQVWIMNADGSGQAQLTFDPTPKDQTPEWSPAGTQIAYTVDASPTAPGGDIWVMNADGSDQHPITSGPEREYGPVWSPDGMQIAFLDVGSDGLRDEGRRQRALRRAPRRQPVRARVATASRR